jgi:ribose 5-phosphate isomerase B
MKIAIGSDHAGYRLKEEIVCYLKNEGYDYTDFGTCSTEPVDYPDVAQKIAEAVVAKEYDRGVIVCGTAIGVSMAANKVPGIRAAVCTDSFTARATREHNDANILTLGERVTGPGSALDIVQTFLTAEFSGAQRHQNRIDKITAIEKKYSRGG